METLVTARLYCEPCKHQLMNKAWGDQECRLWGCEVNDCMTGKSRLTSIYASMRFLRNAGLYTTPSSQSLFLVVYECHVMQRNCHKLMDYLMFLNTQLQAVCFMSLVNTRLDDRTEEHWNYASKTLFFALPLDFSVVSQETTRHSTARDYASDQPIGYHVLVLKVYMYVKVQRHEMWWFLIRSK